MEVIFTLDEIEKVAQKIMAVAKGFKVFAIRGEMGAGKTTLIHAMCGAMGVRDNISSPTFSIINEYNSLKGEIIYHMDLYRLKDEQEAISSGVEDCLYSGNMCLVEWPEKAAGIFPEKTVHLHIAVTGAQSRQLVIQLL